MRNIRYKGGNYTRDARSSYVVVEPLSVTENGTYTAESGKAYNPVAVSVIEDNNAKILHASYDFTTSARYFEYIDIPEGYTGLSFTTDPDSIRYAVNLKKNYNSIDICKH